MCLCMMSMTSFFMINIKIFLDYILGVGYVSHMVPPGWTGAGGQNSKDIGEYSPSLMPHDVPP